MSLATRCPACHTAFRVVQDQLKVSQGWVRCGQCHEVFNAMQALFDLPAAPAPTSSPAVLQTPLAATPAATPAPAEPSAPDTDLPPLPDPVSPEPPEPVAVAPLPLPSSPAAPPPAPDFPASADELPNGFPDSQLAELPNDLVEQPADNWDALTAITLTEAPTQHLEPTLIDPDPDSLYGAEFEAEIRALRSEEGPHDFAPGGEREAIVRQPRFLAEAERAERWRQPGVRLLMGIAVLLLLLLQAAQIIWVQRDLLAARWPAFAPPLAALCESLHCRLQAPLLLDQIVLDSSQLAATRQAGVLMLTADMHNRSSLPVRMPALELTITADTGQILARKILQVQPSESQAPASAGSLEQIDPDGTRALTLYLAVGELQVAGYTVELFYP